MNELISLAKENAFIVIGLLLVTIYLQDRIHDTSLPIRQEMTSEFAAVRQEMASEFAAVRQEMSEFRERLARIETMVERLPRIEAMLEQLLLEKQGQ